MNDIETRNIIFENIKHIDENKNEYWLARELQKGLNYSEYRKFKPIISKAINACISSNQNINDHFAQVSEMISIAKGAKRKIDDYKLSRYACYLIAQNADSRKKVVALGQTYFAIQTRRQELLEIEYNNLSEDEKRLKMRNLTRKENYSLNHTAKNAGVKNFDRFHNYGYKGLYNGETANDIAKRKGLKYREDILDNMGSDELAVNFFRISQTNQKLINDNIKEESKANNTHYKVGKKIRKTIKELNGTMPEALPTPNKSLKHIKNNFKISKKKSD